MKIMLYKLTFSQFASSVESYFLFLSLILLMNTPTLPVYAQIQFDEESEELTIEESIVETEGNNRLNYIGIGGALGLRDEGETALGEGGFSILGRAAFTNNFSIHASAIFNEDDLYSAAVTYSKPIVGFYPFVGAGISAETDDFNLNPEITAGIDLPINSLFTGTARVNANFDDETDIGLLFGVGMIF